jgi:hypothetical protein
MEPKSARVMVPVGKVALVVAVVASVSEFAPLVAKSPASVSVPVVKVGAPVPPERIACPDVPTPEKA